MDQIFIPEPMAWERLPDEPSRQFAWFEAYRLLGPTRSLTEAYRQTHPGSEKARKSARSGLPQSFLRAAQQFDWKQRAEAFDLYMQRQLEEEYEAKLIAFRERTFAVGNKLLERAEKILEWPLHQQKTTNTRTTGDDRTIIQEITIEPARFTADTAHRMAKAATELVCASEGIYMKQLSAEADKMTDADLLAWAKEIVRSAEEH